MLAREASCEETLYRNQFSRGSAMTRIRVKQLTELLRGLCRSTAADLSNYTRF